MDLGGESGPQGETVTSAPNERIAFGSERLASEEEQPDVEGHRYLGTEDPDERIAFGTEQPEVEDFSAQAVERLQRFIEADEAASRAGRTELGQESTSWGPEQTGRRTSETSGDA